MDADEEAIAWARANLAQVATFSLNASLPPLPLPDAFDAIYAVSVFTHLDEPSQIAWLLALGRVLEPSGVLMATVHGAAACGNCSDAERSQLASHGFAYRVGYKGRFKLDGLPQRYQTSFHTREYIGRVWGHWFDILEHAEGALHGHQDVVVLRPRGRY